MAKWQYQLQNVTHMYIDILNLCDTIAMKLWSGPHRHPTNVGIPPVCGIEQRLLQVRFGFCKKNYGVDAPGCPLRSLRPVQLTTNNAAEPMTSK